MFDIDWLGENDPPKKKKHGRPKGSKNKVQRASKKLVFVKDCMPPEPRSLQSAGRPKGSRNSPEVLVKSGRSVSDSHAIRSVKTDSAPAPEGQDYHLNMGNGRVYPHFNPWDTGWE